MKLPILKSTKPLLPAATVLLAAIIFLADTFTDLEVAVPAFYTAVVLLSVRFCNRRGVIYVAAACIGLTIVSDLLTTGSATEAGIINTLIGMAAIVTTTYLALQIEAVTAAAYEARSQLAHVGRVAILGELTASIAHEVNQPLAATVANGNACLRWLAVDPPELGEARHTVENIVNDANRASAIIARLRALTQREPGETSKFAINDVINDTLALTDKEIQSHRILLQTRLGSDLPLVSGDRIQLQQVLLNLILNAIDAMDQSSEGARELAISTAPGQSKSIVISIADTGVGLPKEKPDRLFDAFYTSKPGGMGMGLAISRSIVESHDGKIWAEPNSPRGAIFRFRLPCESR